MTALVLILIHPFVGTVFVTSPAGLLYNAMAGLGTIFVSYILATLLPIDKIIDRFYPVFGALLLIGKKLLILI